MSLICFPNIDCFFLKVGELIRRAGIALTADELLILVLEIFITAVRLNVFELAATWVSLVHFGHWDLCFLDLVPL